jgi:hypothetical protein
VESVLVALPARTERLACLWDSELSVSYKKEGEVLTVDHCEVVWWNWLELRFLGLSVFPKSVR